MSISRSRRAWGARGRKRQCGTAELAGAPVESQERRPRGQARGRWYTRKGRWLGQEAMVSVVRGTAYAIGLAIGGGLIYWFTQSF